MTAALLTDLTRFLSDLEQAQSELRALFAAKSDALRRALAAELIRISEVELELSRRMQGLLSQRHRLLENAAKQGLAASSLRQLAGAIGGEACESLEGRIRLAERRSAELRHESWIHWIISHRCYNHYTELLDLIAHGGRKAPTYGDRPRGTTAGSRGAILDASI